MSTFTTSNSRITIFTMFSTQIYPVHIIQQSVFEMQDMKMKFHTAYSNNMVKIKPT